MSEPFSKQSVARQLDYCTYCPKLCRHACPVSNADGKETHTPQSKMDLLNQLRLEQLPWTTENCEPLWACTNCRQCTGFCDHDNEPGLVLLAGRAEAVKRSAGHPNLANFLTQFAEREERLLGRLAEDVAETCVDGTTVVGFWPGCDALDTGMKDVQTALSFFAKIGGERVEVIHGAQVCGGAPLLSAGYPEQFRTHAQAVAETLRPYKKVITNCSSCLFSMQRQYAAEGIELGPEIQSISAYLAARIADMPKRADKKPIYYHDPCQLARHSGIIEEPRMVLSRIAELRDFDWSHSDTDCCGGAGGLRETSPDTADMMASKRLRSVANRGGGTVVTACASCTYMLERNAPANVKVVDLTTFVAAACTE